MKVRFETIRLSASDLSNHLGCQHVTSLDLWVLQERGRAHEDSYLAADGRDLADLREIGNEEEAQP